MITPLNQVPERNHWYAFEERLWSQRFSRIMGLDEAGRGCLAGPVVAAGVIIRPDERLLPEINDSKKLSHRERVSLSINIKERSLVWAVAWCDNREIDRLNILKASLHAMLRCAEKVEPPPDYLLIDGNQPLPSSLIPQQPVIGGDALSASIAAASILAKVHRDEIMCSLATEYPQYGWNNNKGYPTKMHYRALEVYGITPYHRNSFRLGTTLVHQK